MRYWKKKFGEYDLAGLAGRGAREFLPCSCSFPLHPDTSRISVTSEMKRKTRCLPLVEGEWEPNTKKMKLTILCEDEK